MDFKEERKRLRKEIRKIEKDMETSNRKLSKREFLEKAPPEIVDDVRKKVETLGIKLEKLNNNLKLFGEISDEQ
jgi:valyl-tRNA synthetase